MYRIIEVHLAVKKKYKKSLILNGKLLKKYFVVMQKAITVYCV